MLSTAAADDMADEIGRFREFVDAFSRNSRGNLSAKIGKTVMAIFPRTDKTYAWSIADRSKPKKKKPVTFSSRDQRFKTETQALVNLWEYFSDPSFK